MPCNRGDVSFRDPHRSFPFLSFFRFLRFFITLVHALPDSGHDGCGEIEGRIQHLFWDSSFPGVRQALVDSRLAVANDGNGDAEQLLLPIRQQVRGVGIVVILAKIRFFRHKASP